MRVQRCLAYVLRQSLPVFIVYKVTEAWCVDDSQTKADTVLLDVCTHETSENTRFRGHQLEDEPALMLSIATVWGRSALGGRGSLGGYRRVLKSVLMSVDFPRPDSPSTGARQVSTGVSDRRVTTARVPTTMVVNWKPFLTLFLCTWFGRLANPT